MKRPNSWAWSIATVVAAAAVAYAVARIAVREGAEATAPLTLHDWLHENLDITAEQEARLLPMEVEYEERRALLLLQIRDAGDRLAEVIRRVDGDTAEVTAARGELTRLQGDLQQATLDHFFAMKQHLDPEQGEKLVEWTRRSIIDERVE